MKKPYKPIFVLFIYCIILLTFSGCGDWRYGEDESFPTKILSWHPPTTYQDGSSLNPETDLDSFEIYLKETPNFVDTDSEMVVISSYDKATGQICTSFNLANLAPFISIGVTYHVSIRAVAKNGQKSDFSPAASFSY